MKIIRVGNYDLEYIDLPASQPDRPVVMLLHEGLGCVAMWRDFPQRVAELSGCRVIAWSRAGYGRSTPHAAARTPRYMHIEAEAVPPLMDALGIERAVLVGHSDGGSIALLTAAAFPARVAGLVVMAPHEFVEEETLAGIRVARTAWQTTNLPEKLARYHADAPKVFSDWNDCWLSPPFRDWNIEDCLPAIRCPVLALQGRQDEYATLRQIEVIAEVVPQTTLLALDNCAHTPQRDQEAAVLSAIGDFISRVAGS